MLTKEQLYVQDIMPEWADISLALYKEFSEDCLFPKTFRYYLENQLTIDVQFKEWAMKHLWSIHHINSRIDKNKLFEAIDNGLCISDFRQLQLCGKDWMTIKTEFVCLLVFIRL